MNEMHWETKAKQENHNKNINKRQERDSTSSTRTKRIRWGIQAKTAIDHAAGKCAKHETQIRTIWQSESKGDRAIEWSVATKKQNRRTKRCVGGCQTPQESREWEKETKPIQWSAHKYLCSLL